MGICVGGFGGYDVVSWTVGADSLSSWIGRDRYRWEDGRI